MIKIKVKTENDWIDVEDNFCHTTTSKTWLLFGFIPIYRHEYKLKHVGKIESDNKIGFKK